MFLSVKNRLGNYALGVLSHRRTRTTVLVMLLGVTFYRAATVVWPGANPNSSGRSFEEDYDTRGVVPGNPQNAIDDLKQIYRVIQTFKNENGLLEKQNGLFIGNIGNNSKGRSGLLMTDPFMLSFRAKLSLELYGFKNEEEVDEIFRNPDAQYDDRASVRENWSKFIAYNNSVPSQPFKRLNGTFTDAPKAASTRDVLLYTSIYYHKNMRNENGIRVPHPTGFYVVLWEDGQVEKIPCEEVLWAPMGNNFYLPAFRNQAGVPKHALTQKQYLNQQQLQRRLRVRKQVD